MSSIKVTVRVRPFNQRERDRNATSIIEMQGDTTRITNPTTFKHNTFTFDYSFWSHNPEDAHFATQDMVYANIGNDMIAHAFDGYNVCIFAYGQTGAYRVYPASIPRISSITRLWQIVLHDGVAK